MLKIGKGFLDNITVAKKSFLLLLISAFGLLSLGAMIHFGLYNIKTEVDHIHTEAVQNIAAIQEFQYVCNTELREHLQNYIQHKTNGSHTILNLQEDSLKINQAFNKLKNRSPESAKQLTQSIQLLNKTFLAANKALEEKNKKVFEEKLIPAFHKKILNCNKTINTIIHQKLSAIDAIKAKIEEHYYGTLISAILFIIIILFFSTILSYSVYQNIKRLIFGLSNIVAKKTKDYQELALQLEYKVNKEVIKNREKDQIMYQHARLAAMGEMIGNIAHQWRQPLNALTVLIQSFGIKNMSGGLTQEFIDKQVEEGLRLANQMSTTIEDFKNFFSPHKEREYFGVVQALNETLDLVEFFCKDEHIDIKLIAKEEVRVYGYSNEFSQVILNLLNNARDNFKQKNIQKERKIIIKVERKNRPEPYVMISFVDNGGGIDEHIIDRIFEPYFTTKHKSTGTGIGLYMSKQIIEKQMHGLVTMKNITSKMGTNNVYRCAQFIIAIPLK